MKAAVAIILFAGIALGQAKPPDSAKPASMTKALDETYRDESHCLTISEIRGDADAPISCYCRDAISEARYVYFTYLLPGRDDNLSGIVLALQELVMQKCGKTNYDFIHDATESKDWKWNGPEVVRTYPAQGVIDRVSPEQKDGKPAGRWIYVKLQVNVSAVVVSFKKRD